LAILLSIWNKSQPNAKANEKRKPRPRFAWWPSQGRASSKRRQLYYRHCEERRRSNPLVRYVAEMDYFAALAMTPLQFSAAA
jgi:hypothetical protein